MQISQSSVLLRNGQQEQFVEVPEKQKEVFLDFKKIDFKAPKFAFFQRYIGFVKKRIRKRYAKWIKKSSLRF